MTDLAPRRLTLLFQLYLASQASRRFMRLALANSDMSGEEYALYSYLYGAYSSPDMSLFASASRMKRRDAWLVRYSWKRRERRRGASSVIGLGSG